MYIDLTRGKRVKCSKCGSTNAVHPRGAFRSSNNIGDMSASRH